MSRLRMWKKDCHRNSPLCETNAAAERTVSYLSESRVCSSSTLLCLTDSELIQWTKMRWDTSVPAGEDKSPPEQNHWTAGKVLVHQGCFFLLVYNGSPFIKNTSLCVSLAASELNSHLIYYIWLVWFSVSHVWKTDTGSLSTSIRSFSLMEQIHAQGKAAVAAQK